MRRGRGKSSRISRHDYVQGSVVGVGRGHRCAISGVVGGAASLHALQNAALPPTPSRFVDRMANNTSSQLNPSLTRHFAKLSLPLYKLYVTFHCINFNTVPMPVHYQLLKLSKVISKSSILLLKLFSFVYQDKRRLSLDVVAYCVHRVPILIH